jgi:phospholipid-translocating ATPase
MKKLHMGTMSYGFDSMDEVAHQLAIAFGASEEYGALSLQCGVCLLSLTCL